VEETSKPLLSRFYFLEKFYTPGQIRGSSRVPGARMAKKALKFED
jgi:hypothetical protein